MKKKLAKYDLVYIVFLAGRKEYMNDIYELRINDEIHEMILAVCKQ